MRDPVDLCQVMYSYRVFAEQRLGLRFIRENPGPKLGWILDVFARNETAEHISHQNKKERSGLNIVINEYGNDGTESQQGTEINQEKAFSLTHSKIDRGRDQPKHKREKPGQPKSW